MFKSESVDYLEKLQPLSIINHYEYSDEVEDIIRKLLTKNQKLRLGSKDGYKEILRHEWFKDFDFDALKTKSEMI